MASVGSARKGGVKSGFGGSICLEDLPASYQSTPPLITTKGAEVKSFGGGAMVNSSTPAQKVVEEIEDFLVSAIREAIVDVCKEKNVTSTNKETGREEHTSFCLTYLFYCLMKDQILLAGGEYANNYFNTSQSKRGKGGVVNAKDLSGANVLNQILTLSFSEEDLRALVAYCRIEKQLKYWKLLWY